MMWCLQQNPPSWDFFVSCMVASSFDERHVYFRLREPLHSLKFMPDVVWNRFRRLMIPAAELLGFSWSLGREVPDDQRFYSWHYGDVNALASHRSINLMEPPRRQKSYITITLRNSQSMPGRNSNHDAWNKFYDYLSWEGEQVTVLHDNEDDPLPPGRRLKIYADAAMNFGIATGPLALCHFSTNIPYATFVHCSETKEGNRQREYHEKHKFYGKQFGFAKPDQRFVWKEDSFDNLKAEYSAWKEQYACV